MKNLVVNTPYRVYTGCCSLWQTYDYSSVWKLVWRIKAPPKVFNMVWRSLAQCLPTKTIFHAKRVPVTVVCPVCNEEEETIFHALVGCPFAAKCWTKRGWLYNDAADNNFGRCLQRMLDRTKKEEHGEIVTLCWNIWQARNKLVWDQKKSDVNFVVHSAQ